MQVEKERNKDFERPTLNCGIPLSSGFYWLHVCMSIILFSTLTWLNYILGIGDCDLRSKLLLLNHQSLLHMLIAMHMCARSPNLKPPNTLIFGKVPKIKHCQYNVLYNILFFVVTAATLMIMSLNLLL